MGSLPQWWVEKVPGDRASRKVFALTAGNGSRDVMVIKGEGRCLDLEDLATLDSPRTSRPWAKSSAFSLVRRDSLTRVAKEFLGNPVGFQLTRFVCLIEALCWFMIFVFVAAIRSHTWCLIAVGAMGLAWNSALADLKREPKARNLPLKLLDTISTRRAMDGLMDLEETHAGCGEALLNEFLPGKLTPDEKEWWRIPPELRSTTKYDQERAKDHVRRLRPRSMISNFNLHASSTPPPAAPVLDVIHQPAPRSVPASVRGGVAAESDMPDPDQLPTRPNFIIGPETSPRRQSSSLGPPRRRPLARDLDEHGSGSSFRLPEPPSGDDAAVEDEMESSIDVRRADSESALKDVGKEIPKSPFWD